VTLDVTQRASDWLTRLAAARLGAALDLRAVALGWATVDLERTAIDLAANEPAGLLFDPAADDNILGARCRIAPGFAGDLTLVVMEPATEGRLAAFLARHGEGPAVGWFSGASADDAVAVSPAKTGPLGPARLVLGGSRFGPYALILGS